VCWYAVKSDMAPGLRDDDNNDDDDVDVDKNSKN
jgi:hypothetical protein